MCVFSCIIRRIVLNTFFICQHIFSNLPIFFHDNSLHCIRNVHQLICITTNRNTTCNLVSIFLSSGKYLVTVCTFVDEFFVFSRDNLMCAILMRNIDRIRLRVCMVYARKFLLFPTTTKIHNLFKNSIFHTSY